MALLLRRGCPVVFRSNRRLPGDVGMLRNAGEFLRDLLGREKKSTQPAATALCGMESYRAESSCANVIPPSALMASSPESAVASRAGKDHADGPLALVFGQ